MRWAALLLLALSACAPKPAPEGPRPVVVSKQPELVLTFSRPGADAGRLVHDLAARCWLDGVVRGASLIVVAGTGEIRIVGETETLVATRFLTSQGENTRLRLTGTAVTDPAMAARLKATLERAARTGETACPRAR